MTYKSPEHCLIPALKITRYEVKLAKIFNFWTFWPVIQLINNLLKRWFISWNTGLNGQKMQIFAIFASYLASIVNTEQKRKQGNQVVLECEVFHRMGISFQIEK